MLDGYVVCEELVGSAVCEELIEKTILDAQLVQKFGPANGLSITCLAFCIKNVC